MIANDTYERTVGQVALTIEPPSGGQELAWPENTIDPQPLGQMT
jgi:hypothetical protein